MFYEIVLFRWGTPETDTLTMKTSSPLRPVIRRGILQWNRQNADRQGFGDVPARRISVPRCGVETRRRKWRPGRNGDADPQDTCRGHAARTGGERRALMAPDTFDTITLRLESLNALLSPHDATAIIPTKRLRTFINLITVFIRCILRPQTTPFYVHLEEKPLKSF